MKKTCKHHSSKKETFLHSSSISTYESKYYHNLTPQDIFKLFNTNQLGLSTSEASSRISKYGYNELPSKKKVPFIKQFSAQFNDFMIIILIIAAIISFIASIIEGNTDYVDPIIILIIIIFNALIGVIQESKAEHSLESLKKLSAPYANVLRDGIINVLPSRNLVPGDIIYLETGNLVPADIRIIECVNLKIDESSLTGESVPTSKICNLCLTETTPLADRKNMAYSSSIVTNGHGKGIVVSTGIHTEVGHIAKLINEDTSPDTPLQKNLAITSKYLGIIALSICSIIFIIGAIQGRNLFEMFMTSISLAVASIPEGLPIIVTIVLSLGVTKMAENKAIIRKLPAVETLGSATYVCSDKTGTLTQNKMSVTKVHNAYGPMENIDFILSLACLCNNSKLKSTNDSNKLYKVYGEPTENALIYAGLNNNIEINELNKRYTRIHEIPFDSKRKIMTTVHQAHSNPNTYRYITKGALEYILKTCNNYYDGTTIIPLTTTLKKQIQKNCDLMTKDALRVLGIAFKDINTPPSSIEKNNIEKNLCFVGLIGMIDPPRPEAYDAVKKCKLAGITPVMITGDHPYTAFAIANKLDICHDQEEILTGEKLDMLSDEALSKNVKKYKVFARVTPNHKVKIVKALQSNNEIVAMTGDGVNDAPALKAADIGCSMGINGTDVAKNASDMILADDNFATIIEAIKRGRGIYENIRKSIHFLLSCNIGEIISILFAIIFKLPTPLLAIQLLWINLVTDSLPAISLGLEPIDKNILYKNKNTEFFSKDLITKIILEGFLIGIITLIAFILGYNYNIITARTMAFATLGLSQLFHVFNIKTEKSLISINILNNKKLLASFILCVFLQISVITIPTLSNIFKVTKLNTINWLIVISLSFMPIPIIELQKKIATR